MPALGMSRNSDVATGAHAPPMGAVAGFSVRPEGVNSRSVEERGLGAGDKTKTELGLKLPPSLRALSSNQQVAALVRTHAQLQKAEELKPPYPGPVSPVPGTVEAIVEVISTTSTGTLNTWPRWWRPSRSGCKWTCSRISLRARALATWGRLPPQLLNRKGLRQLPEPGRQWTWEVLRWSGSPGTDHVWKIIIMQRL